MLGLNRITELDDFRNLMVKMKQVYGFYYARIKENNSFPVEIDLIDCKTKQLPLEACIVTSCTNPECIYDLETLFKLYKNSEPCKFCKRKMKFDDMFLDASLATIAAAIKNLSNYRVKFFSNQEWRSVADYKIKGRVDTSSTILLQLSSLYLGNALKYQDRSDDDDSDYTSGSDDGKDFALIYLLTHVRH